jgi:hypothetical protein
MDDPENRTLVGDTIRIVCTSQIGSHGTSKVVTGEVIDIVDDGIVVAEADESEVEVPLSSIHEWDLIGLNAHRLDPDKTPVLVRVYPGHRQSDAAEAYGLEALDLAEHGYFPVAHSWAPGEPGVGRVFALGALGATALRPEGALVVTYIHR